VGAGDVAQGQNTCLGSIPGKKAENKELGAFEQQVKFEHETPVGMR
jgi:hypothetical protein